MKIRLSALIPLLLLLSALLSSGLLFVREIGVANRTIEQDGFNNLNTILTHLQNMLDTQLANDSFEDAKLSVSVSSLHPGIQTLLLADRNGTVLLANRYIWEGSPAERVSGYDETAASRAVQRRAGAVSVAAGGTLLKAYYPVTLKIGTGGVGDRQAGALYAEYDLSTKFALARHNAMVQAVSFGGLMVVIAIAVALLLHWLVARRVEKIVQASQRFASGDLDARVCLRGSDELAELGHAFDKMAEQRKQAEEALRHSEDRLRFMLETSPIAVRITVDAGRRVVFANRRYAEQLQIAPAQAGDVDPGSYYANRREYEEIVERLARGESVSDRLIELRIPGAGTKWVLASFLNLDYGREPAVLGWFYDITERKLIDEQLRMYKERLEVLVQERTAMLDDAQRIGKIGNWNWDVASGALSWSDEIFRIFGYRPAEFAPTYERFLATVHPDDLQRIKQSELDAFSRGARHSIDHRIVLPDGSIRWVHEEAVAHLGADGKPLSLAGTVQDITERKRTEEDLIQSRNEAERASQAKTEFLGRMSHELRTPMNAILGFAQLLEVADLSQEQLEYTREIHRAGDHLLELINELLDLSRIESGRLAVALGTVDSDAIVEQAVQWAKPLLGQKQVRLEWSRGANIPVCADPTRLKQILTNLLSNAIKYNHEHGTVSIETTATEAGRVRISVADTGPGIAPKDLHRLFTAFDRLGAESAEVEGAGIGLALSKNLASLMDGELGVESELGVGSRFWIELPAARTAAVAARPPRLAKLLGSPDYSKVLYIEDNIANLKVVEAVFRRLPNLDLLSATNGERGVELARHYRPGVILLDIHLPGMDGYQVMTELRARAETAAIPVIALSADAMPRDIERGLGAGFRHYMTKPFNVEELIGKIHAVLAEGRLAPEPV